MRDAWTPSAGARDGVRALTVPVRQRRRLDLTLVPTRRGDRPPDRWWSAPSGRSGSPDARPSTRLPGRSARCRRSTARKHLPSRLARLRELDGRSTLLQRGQGTEFDSLREYVPGDDVRSIDWRGTARSTTVVVKTWRPERDRHVLIVLDSGRTSAGRVGDQPRLDHAMDAALLLAALASRAGDRVDLLIVDREVRASVLRKSAAEVLPAFVNAMATVEPVLVETDHREMVTEIATRVTQRSLVVIITGLDEAAITEGLIPVLGPLRRRHRVVVAAVSDPRIDELAAGRDDAGEVYAAAAAEIDRSRRARHRPPTGRPRHLGGPGPARAIRARSGRPLPGAEEGRTPLIDRSRPQRGRRDARVQFSSGSIQLGLSSARAQFSSGCSSQVENIATSVFCRRNTARHNSSGRAPKTSSYSARATCHMPSAISFCS